MKLKQILAAALLLCSAGAWAQTDVTSSYITNADFSSTTGWTAYVSSSFKDIGTGKIGWTVKNAASTTDATHLSTEYCFGFECRWSGNYASYNQTTRELQVGHYELTYDVQNAYNNSENHSNYDNLFYVQVGETTYTDSYTEWMSGKKDWTTHTISFDITTPSTVKISLGYGTGSNNIGDTKTPVLYVSHLKLLCTPFATTEDYSNLNTAISAVEGIFWGFDEGEYAPYNYVEVIQALAAAQAIDPTANNSQATVQALTATLNTSLTANAAEVNAIFDGSFEHDYSGQTGNVQPIGWYRVKGTTGDGYNVRYVTSSGNAGLATVGGYGVFTKFAAYYGWEDGYTMPLNASTYYTISFKYGGWGDCKKDGYVTMTDPESESLSLISSNRLPLSSTDANSNTASWTDYSAIFKTNDAGDYVLGLRKDNENQQSQYVYGNFLLKTTTVVEATAYYNTVKDEVDDSYNADANGGTEKTNFKNALDASAPSTVAEIMEAAANLYTLRDAFVAATPKYDAYLAEKTNAERIDASITSGVSAPTTAAEAETALQTILVNEYNYVASNFNADAAATYGITIDQWTGTATSGGNSDTPQTKSNEKWGETATTYYEQGQNGWSSNAWTLNYTKTVTLPANTYVMKVAARASTGATATLKATIGGTTITESLPNVGNTGLGITTDGVASFDGNDTFANSDNGYGWQWRYLAFTLENDGEVTLQIDASANSAQQWCSFGDVAVVSNVSTTAMEAAYNNFTMQTLGFETGQYAPYNNVTVLEAYAQAKAIVEGTAVPSTQVEVDAITATLTTPTWTANVADVDAIYNPDFSLIEGEWEPEGWTRTNSWGAKVSDAASSTGKGYYNQLGSMQYGNSGVYTMPLAAQTNYKLSFKYGYKDQDVTPTISVLNSNNEGLAATTIATAYSSNDYTSSMISQTMYFKTGAAGNYILTIASNKNIVLSDVSLLKTNADNTKIDEASTTAPEVAYYQTLTLTRTLSPDYWNTFCSPVAITAEEITAMFGTGSKVREMDTETAVANNTIAFKDATAIEAGKPYLVKPAQTVTNPSFSGKTVVAAGQTVENGDYKYIGILAKTTLTAPAANATALDLYLSTDGSMKKPGENGANLKGMRAYFNVPVSADGNVKLFIGEDTDAITVIDGEPVAGTAIYNLAGQRISAPQKGVNIINGKKVLVK